MYNIKLFTDYNKISNYVNLNKKSLNAIII